MQNNMIRHKFVRYDFCGLTFRLSSLEYSTGDALVSYENWDNNLIFSCNIKIYNPSKIRQAENNNFFHSIVVQ